MAVFDFPRIHVAGSYLVDPPTTNNDTRGVGAEGPYVSDTEQVRVLTGPMEDEEFAAWLCGLGDDGLIRGQWNPYGDMSFRFLDVAVTGVQVDEGRLLVNRRDDPLLGAACELTDAVMCDTNPEGFDSTQIFAGALQIDAPGALRDGLFISRRPVRATLRMINFCRNVAFTSAIGPSSSAHAGGGSAVFQFAVEVAPGDLEAGSHTGADTRQLLHKFLPDPASPGAVALAGALAEESCRGLVFRMSVYLTYPSIPDPALAAELARGKATHNPARGQVVGTIAPWYRGEAATVTMGRFLRPAGTFPVPGAAAGPYQLGPAVARIDTDARRVRVDLVNALPEAGPGGTKFDLGSVTLGVRAATPGGTDPSTNRSAVTVIGPVANDRRAYRRTGGLVDVDYSGLPAGRRRWLTDGRHELVLQAGRPGAATVLLAETEYHVASDCSCSYLDRPAPRRNWDSRVVVRELAAMPDPALRGEVPVHVYRRGRPAAGRVPLTVELWRMTPTGSQSQPGTYLFPRLVDSGTVVVSDGLLQFRLRPPPVPAVYDYRFVPPGWWPQPVAPGDFPGETGEDARSVVRVLPHDDYSRLADEDVTFAFVYREVLRNYQLLYPAMGEYLDLADPTLWTTPAAVRYLSRVIALDAWPTPIAMPRTRDLPATRRALLDRYCRLTLERAEAAAASLRKPAGPSGTTRSAAAGPAAGATRRPGPPASRPGGRASRPGGRAPR